MHWLTLTTENPLCIYKQMFFSFQISASDLGKLYAWQKADLSNDKLRREIESIWNLHNIIS